jgi:hypothetical protein
MSHLRVLVLDGGYSTTEPAFSSEPLPRGWRAIRDLQEITQSHVVLICGAKYERIHQDKVEEFFPNWTAVYTENCCSGNLALVQDSYAKVQGSESVQLSFWQQRMAQMLQLRVADGSSLCILFTKFHHGTRASNRQFDADQRDVCWDAIFDTLNHRREPWIVCGALGATLGVGCGRSWERTLQEFLETETRDHSRVSALASGMVASKLEIEESALVLQCPFEVEVSRRSVDLSEENPPKRSRANSSGAEPPSTLLLCSRSASFAKKLDEAPLGDMILLSEILYGTRSNITYTDDGYVLTSPTTVQEKAAAVESILQTMDDARVKGAGCESGPLDEQQKTDAYDWLKEQWLEKWTDNPQLRQDFRDMKSGLVAGRAQKKRINARRNSAFNAFLHDFVGNVHVARIMLNGGFTTAAEFQSLLRELHVYYDSPEYKKEKQEQLVRANKSADVKAAAHKARRHYKDAARIDRKVANGEWKYNLLTPTQASMLDNLFILRQSMLTANKAYGFGLGSGGQRTTIATTVAVEYASRVLNNYFAE